LKFMELENYLSDILHTKVDLVMKEALKPNLGKRIFLKNGLETEKVLGSLIRSLYKPNSLKSKQPK
ncbi:MAG: hypothetical protein MUO43_15070, partial [Desulfobacterales bacterium]|nr:hypothetical protein [Desulfobacterales bacterium]